MDAHVDPDSAGLLEVGHQVHTREAHCVASGCEYDNRDAREQAQLQQAARDWKARYGGTNVATRAGDLRARRQINSRLNAAQFGEANG